MYSRIFPSLLLPPWLMTGLNVPLLGSRVRTLNYFSSLFHRRETVTLSQGPGGPRPRPAPAPTPTNFSTSTRWFYERIFCGEYKISTWLLTAHLIHNAQKPQAWPTDFPLSQDNGVLIWAPALLWPDLMRAVRSIMGCGRYFIVEAGVCLYLTCQSFHHHSYN